MFDEFDILNKELSNDFFKIECVIECSSMQNMISLFDDYTTESGGASEVQSKFQALASRVKEIFQKIIENVKSAFNKIRETVSSKVREQKLNEIKNKLQAIKTAAEMDSDFAKELAEKLSGSEWYASKDLCYDFQSYYTTLGDKLQAKIRNLFASATGGKKVSAQDIAEAKAMSRRTVTRTLKKYVVLGAAASLIKYTNEIMTFTVRFMKSFAEAKGGSFTSGKVADALMSETGKNITKISAAAAALAIDAMDYSARRKIEKNRKILADKQKSIAENKAAWEEARRGGAIELYGIANELSNVAAQCSNALAQAEAHDTREQIKALTETLNQINAICSSLYPRAETIIKRAKVITDS